MPAVARAAVPAAAPAATTATPIKHLVVIFQENVSFDHYFGTYPHAANTDGVTFHAAKNTPSVNGLTKALLTANPNENQPMRLTPSEAVTCDQNHDYTPEQQALDNGLMDKFVQDTQVTDCSPPEFTEPEYYASTANPNHLPPASLAEVGHDGQANHQYDLSWFYQDVAAGRMPAVSFLKAARYQDGHPGNSDPIDEQHFLVKAINSIMKSKLWPSAAIMITYDDSDGWYDHVMPPIVNSSRDPALDALNGTGVCGNGTPAGGIPDRCGYGQRLPFLLISPFAKTNYVGSSLADQTSILAFIEDNWLAGERTGTSSFDNIAGSLNDMFTFNDPGTAKVLLNPRTGAVIR